MQTSHLKLSGELLHLSWWSWVCGSGLSFDLYLPCRDEMNSMGFEEVGLEMGCSPDREGFLDQARLWV
jgi:hypothetical protein